MQFATIARACVLSLLAGLFCHLASIAPAAEPAAATGQDELDKRFSKTLSGAALVGYFTLAGEKEQGKLTPDRYTIHKLTKVDKDHWQFDVQIQYAGVDLSLPLVLEVRWASDTPVVTMTDMGVPGLGTFSARVLFYRGQYAGTWSHGEKGGQLFGRIVPAETGQGTGPAPDHRPRATQGASKKGGS